MISVANFSSFRYCRMEQELQSYLDNYEGTHDYDEYHFDLDDIET